MKKLFTILLLPALLLLANLSMGQVQSNMYYMGEMNDWNAVAMSSISLPSTNYNWVVSIQSDGDDDVSEFKFANTSDWTDKDWSSSITIDLNTNYDWNEGWGANTKFDEDNSYFYIFTFKDVATFDSKENSQGYVFKFSSSPVDITSVTESNTLSDVYPGQETEITATIVSKPDNQKIFLRCSNNADFSSSSLIEMSNGGSGNNYTASIPDSVNSSGSTVYYYAFSTGNTTPTDGQADAATINFYKPTNFSYLVESSWTTAVGATNWSVAASWDAGEVPASGQPVTIENDITLNQNVEVSSITISEGATFTASDGAKATRTLTIADGGSLTNNGTFTAADGTVVFAGSGVVDGTVVFNNVDISGAVNFGGSSTINGILTINNGGSTITNSPKYGMSSTLNYYLGGGYDSRIDQSLEWPASNSPNNIVIDNNTWVQLTNDRSISGNLTITNGALQSLGGKGLTMSGTSQIITVSTSSGGAIYGTDNGEGNDLSLVIADGSTTTLSGDITTTSSNEKKFYNITVSNGGTLELNRGILCKYGTFSVAGTLQINNGGYVQSSNGEPAAYSSGNLIYNSGVEYATTDYEWPSTISTPDNVTIQNSGTSVLLNSNKSIGATLSISSDASLTIPSDNQCTVGGDLTISAAKSTRAAGSLTIKSDATGTGSLIVNGTVTGSITAERYIEGYSTASGDGWHLLSSPVSNSITINDSDFDPGEIENGDPTDDDFYGWSEADYEWKNHKAGNLSTIEPGIGYLVSYQNTGDSPRAFVGELNGDKTINLSYTSHADAEQDGLNLIGNPFSSAIDWDEVTKTGSINTYAYIWDGSQYKATGGVEYTNFDGIIPAHNGFFVVAEATGASITMTKGSIANGGDQTHGTSFYKETKTASNLIALNMTGNGYEDKTYVHLNSNASNGYDIAYDAYKMYGIEAAPQLYSMNIDGRILSINELPVDGYSEIVELGVKVGAETTYTINASTILDFDEVMLEDLQNGVMTDLTSSAYEFTATPEDAEHRFNLHISKSTFGIEEGTELEGLNVYAYANQIYINSLTDLTNATVSVYNTMGQMVATQQVNTGFETIEISAMGAYIVKVQSEEGVMTQKVIIK